MVVISFVMAFHRFSVMSDFLFAEFNLQMQQNSD